jgi:NADH-quinone oxidoreductase subunit L
MGGLFKKMPITGLTFLIASLANCAIPFFSGAYSKDAIISAAFLAGHDHGAIYFGVYGLVLCGALCTALYSARLFSVVFLGAPRSEAAAHAHETGPAMTVPLVVLGVLSLAAGWTGLIPARCAAVFVEAVEKLHTQVESIGVGHTLEIINVAVVLAGLAASIIFYLGVKDRDALAAKAPGVFHVLERHGWFDDVYDWYVAHVQQRVCDILGALDLLVCKFALGWGSGGFAGLTGALLRRLQVGSIHAYVYWFLAGVILFWAFAIH